MAFLTSLNATCDLNEYLFCKMPKGPLEVELKIKTTWGKLTMAQNTHTRTEKFHTWEKAQWCHPKSRKGRTPYKATSVPTEDTTSEADMPTSQEFENPPPLFINPTHTAVTPHTNLDSKAVQDENFQADIVNIVTEVQKHTVIVFHLIGNKTLMLATPILL